MLRTVALVGAAASASAFSSTFTPAPATLASQAAPVAGTVGSTPAASPAILPDISLARVNFNRWNDALQTKNAKTVANMYVTSELSFLPTVSPQHIKSGGASSNTEDYFVEFVKKNPF